MVRFGCFFTLFLDALALTETGGMALLCFSLTKFSSKIDHDDFYFADNYQIQLLRNTMFSL